MEAWMTLVMDSICSMGFAALINAPRSKIQLACLPAEFKYLLEWPFWHVLWPDVEFEGPWGLG